MSFLTELPRDRYSPDAFAGFDATSSAFALGTARAMAWMSQLAYETSHPAKIRDIASGWELTITARGIIAEVGSTILPTARTELIVAVRGPAVIVAFAGTDPIVFADWITDFTIPVGDGGTATGFAAAAALVAQSLDAVLAASPPGARLYITGHSLGAALAALTAQRLAAVAPERLAAVYTFGMPRVGNAAFAQAYEAVLGARTYRMVHGDDLVPTVPPSSLGFHHVGRHLSCPRQGRFSPQNLSAARSDEPQFQPQLARQVQSLLRQPLGEIRSTTERLGLAARLALGFGSRAMRTDPGGVLIELLPPPLRDHMPDRYIAAT